MARRLHWPAGDPPLPAARPGSRYPWDKWLDGSVWEFVPGKDFTGTVQKFRCTLLLSAPHYDMRVVTRLTPRGRLQVMAVPWLVNPDALPRGNDWEKIRKAAARAVRAQQEKTRRRRQETGKPRPPGIPGTGAGEAD